MYYPCSENKGADQLRSNCEAESAPLFCAYSNCWFSNAAAYTLFLGDNWLLYMKSQEKFDSGSPSACS